MSTILISYCREDTADVIGRIYDRLIQQFGRGTVFKYVDSISPGDDFLIHLDDKWLHATCSCGDWRGLGEETGAVQASPELMIQEILSALRSSRR